MKKKDIILLSYITFSIIYVFFSYIKFVSSRINVNTIFLVISICYLAYFIIMQKKIFMYKSDIVSIIFFIYLIFSCLFINSNAEGIKFAIFFVVINIIHIMFREIGHEKNFLIEMTYWSTLFHSIMVVLQLLFPNIIMKICNVILQEKSLQIVESLYKNKYYTGITVQAAVSGLFATILIGISLTKILTKDKRKYFNIIAIIIGIVALLLSKKRAFLVVTIISSIMIIFIYNRDKKNRVFKNILICGVIFMIMTIALMVIPETKNLVDRFINNDRLLSGRDVMYEEMFHWYEQNKLFGIGLGTATEQFGYGGHNIYLQMLAECGSIGFCLFVLYMINMFIINIKIVIKNKNKNAVVLLSVFMQTALIIYGITGNPIYDYTFLTIFLYLIVIPKVYITGECKNEKY